MLRTIHVGGELGAKYVPEIILDVQSVGEALRAMDCNYPGFMRDIKKDEHYNVCVGSYDDDHALDNQTLRMNHKKGDIWITPSIEGAKAGMMQTILGAVLIVVGVVLSIYGFGAGTPLIKLGAGLMISGVVTMLTPVPGTPEYTEREKPGERQSFLFDGAVNTNEQGGSIPVAYGQVLIGSTVVSTALDVEDIPYKEPFVPEPIVRPPITPRDPITPHGPFSGGR